jgi:hypothetical protein
MKISDLITALERYREKFGDIDVASGCDRCFVKGDDVKTSVMSVYDTTTVIIGKTDFVDHFSLE